MPPSCRTRAPPPPIPSSTRPLLRFHGFRGSGARKTCDPSDEAAPPRTATVAEDGPLAKEHTSLINVRLIFVDASFSAP